MSSLGVRALIKSFVATNAPSEKAIDLSGQYAEIENLIADHGITRTDPWLGLQFIGNDENPITVGSTNTSGKYREMGSIYIHVVDIAKFGAADTILARAESLRNLFRGQRIGGIVIESVTPPNFDMGATLSFEGGYTSASFMVGYYKDLDL